MSTHARNHCSLSSSILRFTEEVHSKFSYLLGPIGSFHPSTIPDERSSCFPPWSLQQMKEGWIRSSLLSKQPPKIKVSTLAFIERRKEAIPKFQASSQTHGLLVLLFLFSNVFHPIWANQIYFFFVPKWFLLRNSPQPFSHHKGRALFLLLRLSAPKPLCSNGRQVIFQLTRRSWLHFLHCFNPKWGL